MNRRRLFARTIGALAAAAVAPIVAKMPWTPDPIDVATVLVKAPLLYTPRYGYGVVKLYDHSLISSRSFEEAFQR